MLRPHPLLPANTWQPRARGLLTPGRASHPPVTRRGTGLSGSWSSRLPRAGGQRQALPYPLLQKGGPRAPHTVSPHNQPGGPASKTAARNQEPTNSHPPGKKKCLELHRAARDAKTQPVGSPLPQALGLGPLTPLASGRLLFPCRRPASPPSLRLRGPGSPVPTPPGLQSASLSLPAQASAGFPPPHRTATRPCSALDQRPLQHLPKR